ncbi:hypothetical protein BG011_000862 [Mortierella polycephala]|uniref:DUF1772-domain-containing protein n=1 Tax=Mortierella polycephala TaxID=41804 RepID=A0A9P6QIB5_9FUNG|nr:hypothetical protein BG011_000862 [Mortierella polycephala]
MSLSHNLNVIFNGETFLLVTKTVTIASMGIAAGAGLSYNAMILPALSKLPAANALAVWCETAKGAMPISVLGGSIVYYKTKNKSFLYSAMIMLSILPYTWTMFFPINGPLFEMNKTGTNDSTIEVKFRQWNRNQYGRVLLNVAAMAVALYGGLHQKKKIV